MRIELISNSEETMKLYVISTKYQPLVTVNDGPSFNKKTFSKKCVSPRDLQTTFDASKIGGLIACDNKEDALRVMSLLIKGHNTTPDLIEKGVQFFAVPVIYTVEVDSAQHHLTKQTTLTADDLVNYADTGTIPFYYSSGLFKEAEKLIITQKLRKYSKDITIRKLTGLQLEAVTDASYLDSSGSVIVDVNLRPVVNPILKSNMQILGGFIAAIGIAAVATAFVALNAATFGIAGLVVAGLGAVAILGGVGLFAVGTCKKYQSTPDAVKDKLLVPAPI